MSFFVISEYFSNKFFRRDHGIPIDFYLKRLKCANVLDLLKKFESKFRLFQDSKGNWRVAVVKTEENAQVVELVDADIDK